MSADIDHFTTCSISSSKLLGANHPPMHLSNALNVKLTCRDPQAMSEENQKALRSLYRRAVSQNLHVVNPVDRLLMMFAEVTQKSAGQNFTLVLQNAGVDQLLHAAELGLYDFLGDTPPNAMQLKSRKEYCTTILWALSSHKDFQLRPRQGGSSQQKMVAREPTRVSPTSTTCA